MRLCKPLLNVQLSRIITQFRNVPAYLFSQQYFSETDSYRISSPTFTSPTVVACVIIPFAVSASETNGNNVDSSQWMRRILQKLTWRKSFNLSLTPNLDDYVQNELTDSHNNEQVSSLILILVLTSIMPRLSSAHIGQSYERFHHSSAQVQGFAWTWCCRLFRCTRYYSPRSVGWLSMVTVYRIRSLAGPLRSIIIKISVPLEFYKTHQHSALTKLFWTRLYLGNRNQNQLVEQCHIPVLTFTISKPNFY